MTTTFPELIERIDKANKDYVYSQEEQDLWKDVHAYLTSLSAAHTIKPLVWRETGKDLHESGNYSVWMEIGGKWRAYVPGLRIDCDSLAHGKQFCQAHWESEAGIGKYLERVK